MQYIVCFSKKYRIQVPFFTPKENTARYCGVFLLFFVKSTVYRYSPKQQARFRNKILKGRVCGGSPKIRKKFCASILTNFIYSV